MANSGQVHSEVLPDANTASGDLVEDTGEFVYMSELHLVADVW